MYRVVNGESEEDEVMIGDRPMYVSVTMLHLIAK